MEKAILLEQMGAFGTGGNRTYYPQDMINCIKDFAFYDKRSLAYAKKVSDHNNNIIQQIHSSFNSSAIDFESNEIDIDANYVWGSGNDIQLQTVFCYSCGEYVETSLTNMIPPKVACHCEDDLYEPETESDTDESDFDLQLYEYDSD